MQRVKVAISSFRDSILSPCFPSRTAPASQAMRHLEPIVRSALAETVQEDARTSAAELKEIDEQLAVATKALKEASDKENFLDLRYRQYRKVLDEKAQQLHAEREELMRKKEQQEKQTTDEEEAKVEEGNEDVEIASKEVLDQHLKQWETRMEKWEKDEDALKTIHDTQKKILTQCEEIRRKIRALELRKNKLLYESGQHEEFLSVTAAENSDDIEKAASELELLCIEEEEEEESTQQQSIDRDENKNNISPAVGKNQEEEAMIESDKDNEDSPLLQEDGVEEKYAQLKRQPPEEEIRQ